jgi:protein-S-isoprenylcysteine O-methyltransferase Ste14
LATEESGPRKAALALRALAFLVLIPGAVTIYIPLQILRAMGDDHRPGISVLSAAGLAVAGVGALLLLRCVWDFFQEGRGTLAPIDPPRELVVRGLYRYTRNPMYNGVVAMLLGEAALFRSTGLLCYSLLMFVLFHLAVVVYEEPSLQAKFGEQYHSYRRRVPRWGFRKTGRED